MLLYEYKKGSAATPTTPPPSFKQVVPHSFYRILTSVDLGNPTKTLNCILGSLFYQSHLVYLGPGTLKGTILVLGEYLEGHGDLVSSLIIGITRV